MAKKARRKPDEDAEFRSFQFPEFDESKFLRHEFEQSTSTILAIVLAVLLGVVSYLIDRTGLYFVPPIVGLAVIAFSPWIIQRLRPPKTLVTKGEWAGLIATQIFGWLGIWFLLLNVFRF